MINNLRLQLGNYSEWEPFWELIKVLLNEASDVQRKKNEQFDVKILELIENEKWQEIVEFLEENTYEDNSNEAILTNEEEETYEEDTNA